MLLTLKTQGSQASEIGFLLHKHPDRFQSFPVRFGVCHAFYPQVESDAVTFCLMLDLDSTAMARNKQSATPFALAKYVNDRPYVASSMMSSAIVSALRSALNGKCAKRPELVDKRWEWTIEIDVLPVKGGYSFLKEMFEPLGYKVDAQSVVLDSQFPQWGDSSYFHVRLACQSTLCRVLRHLYILMPVFDLQKHYFSGSDELEKLLAKGEAWLADHPARDSIIRRYLRFQPHLRRQAISQLTEDESRDSETRAAGSGDEQELRLEGVLGEKKVSLNRQRLDAVQKRVIQYGGRSLLDLGCGEGKLLKRLLKHSDLSQIVGVDVSLRCLELAHRRLKLDQLPDFQAQRIQLMHASLGYRDQRLEGFDIATVVEVIEHLDPHRLEAFERVLFRHARPNGVIVTTPNSEFNVVWESLPAGKFRHPDHRFEWTRDEFLAWCQRIEKEYGYSFEIEGIGPIEASVGTPTQMACFRKVGKAKITLGCGRTYDGGNRPGGDS